MSKSTQISPQKQFEDKVTDRLKSDIGELIPDEALSELVQRAMQTMFFEPKKTTNGQGYRSKTVRGPSFFEAEVLHQVKPLLEREIKTWVNANEEGINIIIKEALSKEGDVIVADFFRNLIRGEMYQITSTLEHRISEIGSNLHLQPQY